MQAIFGSRSGLTRDEARAFKGRRGSRAPTSHRVRGACRFLRPWAKLHKADNEARLHASFGCHFTHSSGKRVSGPDFLHSSCLNKNYLPCLFVRSTHAQSKMVIFLKFQLEVLYKFVLFVINDHQSGKIVQKLSILAASK